MKRANIFITFGIILLLTSVALAAYNIRSSFSARVEATSLLYGLEDQMLTDIEEKTDTVDYMPVKAVENIEIIGTISIPSVGIELPVSAEWSYDNLKKTACRYAGSPKGGRMIIMAHNYAGFFGDLRAARENDDVQFLDAGGSLFRYTVSSIEILDKYELDRLTDSMADLTLFTCNYTGSKRIVLRCAKKAE